MGRITYLTLALIALTTTPAQASTCADSTTLTYYGNGYDNASYPLANAVDGDVTTYGIATGSPFLAEIHTSSGQLEDFSVTVYNPSLVEITVNLRTNSGAVWSSTYSQTVSTDGSSVSFSAITSLQAFDYYEVSLSPASSGDIGIYETIAYLTDCDDDGRNDTDNGGDDCDDTDASVNPLAIDTWYDGIDSDCAGDSDYDADADGYESDAYSGTDCDDADASINPGATETANGVDDNCDGTIDEGADTFDDDGDGYAEDAGDCNDSNAAIYPGAVDTWYDGIDQNCDDANDYDQDEDGNTSELYSGDDCDDSNAAINPGATETFYDGIDQDCGYDSDYDADYDGYDSDTYGGDDCNDADSTISPGTEEIWYDGVDQDCVGDDDYDQDWDGYQSDAYGGTDCDDTANNIYVGAVDTWYDGIDSDCAGNSDFDQDVDGYDSSAYGGTDCEDLYATINPGAIEYCDGVDNNCDGTIDSDAVDLLTYYTDSDADGYGDSATATEGCDIPEGSSDVDGDCDDTNVAFYPGAPETDCADPNDYNCDGSTGYDDLDLDTYAACTECDDSDAAVFPGATEYCNEVDDDCDGTVDEDAVDPSTWYADSDGDGHGDATVTTTGCAAPEGYVADASDCDDTNAAINSGATEVCDKQDNNCNGAIDEGCDTGDTGDTGPADSGDSGEVGDTDETGTRDTADVIFPVDDTGRDGKFAGGGGFSCGGCATGGGNFASLWMGMISLMLMLRRQK